MSIIVRQPILILVLMLASYNETLSQQRYRFENVEAPDGVIAGAHSIVQDSLGFLWIHSPMGLSRYDGYSFKNYLYNQKDSLRSPGYPLDGWMLVDRTGTVWLKGNQLHTTNNALVLSRYNVDIDGFVKYKPDVGESTIYSLCFDRNDSVVWLGTFPGRGLYSYNYETGETKRFINNLSKQSEDFGRGSTIEPRNAIFDLSDRGSWLLLATWDGLWSFDKATKKFSRPLCNAKDTLLLYHHPVFQIYERNINNTDHLWISIVDPKESWNVLVKLDDDSSIIQNLDIPLEVRLNRTSNAWPRADIDQDGVIWISSEVNGLFRLDPRDSSLFNVTEGKEYQHKLTSNDRNLKILADNNSRGKALAEEPDYRMRNLQGVLVDRDQNVWTASEHWISKLRKPTLNLHTYKLGKQIDAATVYSKNGRAMVMVSTKDPSSQSHNELAIAEINRDRLSSAEFRTITPDPPVEGIVNQLHMGKSRLWIGTFNGLASLNVDPASGDIVRNSLKEYKHDPQNPNTLSSNTIFGIWEDSEENLWAGTAGAGLNQITSPGQYGNEGSVKRYFHSPTDSNSISSNEIWWDFYPEGDDAFFVRTSAGIDLLRNNRFEHVVKSNSALSVKRTADGTLLVGLMGAKSGLYASTKKGNRYLFEEEPFISYGTQFQEDRKGRLWISGNRKLYCYDPKDLSTAVFTREDGINLSLDVFTCQQTTNGIFAMFKDDMVTLLDPLSVEMSNQIVQPVLTRLIVNNEMVPVGELGRNAGEFFIKEEISVLDELELDYKHNNFSIEFSAMQMTDQQKNRYRHMLEGYDGDWIESDHKNRAATYTNLDAGTYTFKVRATNHHGVWGNREARLSVVILPPPWKTIWAYGGYALVIVLAGLLARRIIVQRERLKSNLKLAKLEQEKEHFELEKAKEVDKVKSTFFANISHEFRTPLTLIKGPAQELMEEFTDHPKVKDRVKVIERNADFVLKLINQLLDLAKLESGSLLVEKSENDLNKFLRVVTSSFSSLAFQKNITMELEFPNERNVVSFDKEKVETILINLINNAIKFTPAGGTVAVRTELRSRQVNTETHSAGTPLWRRGEGLSAEGFAKAEGEVMTLVVSDNGIGIDKDQHEKIFERFHQVSESHKEVGTGIGLSLVKELVALMNGSISLKSELGKGSEFTVTLPVEVIRPVTELEDEENLTAQFVSEEVTLSENRYESADNKPYILVVEDNSDLRKFIIGSLGNEFHFLEAADGKRGLAIAIENTPDLIVSDVMMPEMDGITMTGKLKKDTRTSHIPLILLTAKTTDESKLSGLSTGADDYLTKPFNKQELLLKVRNSIALQVRLREKIRLELLKESPKVEVQSADEKFLLKVKETILARLSDEQLSVESLAEEIALSRSQLLRKITALTGVSVNELIRTFRLQKAAQLLEQNWGPVTQVAYEVGFSNLSYFSKVFKEQYGVLPSEYLSIKANEET